MTSRSVHTEAVASMVADPTDDRTHPWGIEVGDPVHYWREGAPPLSQGYTAPECWHALILGFSYDDKLWWYADLAVVDPSDGSLRLFRGVRFSPGSAQIGQYGNLSDRSFGVGPSWHSANFHPNA